MLKRKEKKQERWETDIFVDADHEDSRINNTELIMYTVIYSHLHQIIGSKRNEIYKFGRINFINFPAVLRM